MAMADAMAGMTLLPGALALIGTLRYTARAEGPAARPLSHRVSGRGRDEARGPPAQCAKALLRITSPPHNFGQDLPRSIALHLL